MHTPTLSPATTDSSIRQDCLITLAATLYHKSASLVVQKGLNATQVLTVSAFINNRFLQHCYIQSYQSNARVPHSFLNQRVDPTATSGKQEK